MYVRSYGMKLTCIIVERHLQRHGYYQDRFSWCIVLKRYTKDTKMYFSESAIFLVI